MSLTFDMVDKTLKSYGLVSKTRKNGQLTEYKFENRKTNVRKQNVVTEVRPLLSGGVRGYIYVDHLSEYDNDPKKTAKGHIPIVDMTVEEFKDTIEKVINNYH